MDARACYQPEIDGLRAVAIIPVVLFHAGWRLFRNGFVGVDVFFVISGFLISRLLLAELQQTGSIDFAAFYARRIRRLFPALATVVVAVLVLGAFVLSAAGERQHLSKSAMATMAFVSNIYFWHRQAAYFAPPTTWVPLLNMWTLSVEEQFYLFWPLLLALTAMFAGRIGRSTRALLGVMLALLFAVSMASYLWGSSYAPTAAFYLAPTRAWEFALGAALALAERSLQDRRGLGAWAALLGLAVIAATVASLWSVRWFLGDIMSAAFGTALLIGGLTAAPQSHAARLLRIKPLVAIGKLSYSWYLWHWPLLALVRVYAVGEASVARDLLVVLVALGLAALTFRFIEDPIRRRRPRPFSGVRSTLAAGAGLSSAVVAVALMLQVQADAALKRDPWLTAVDTAAQAQVKSPPGCHTFRRATPPPASDCRIGASQGPPRILLWGDSQAEQLTEMLRIDGMREGYAAIAWSMSACAPVLNGSYGRGRSRRRCDRFNDAVVARLPALARAGVTGIVLASRNFAFPGRSDAAARAAWNDKLRAILARAGRLGMRVVLVGPIPVFRLAIPQCLAHASPARCGGSRAAYARQRAPLMAALARTIGEFPNARLWDPFDHLCGRQVCTAMHDDVIFYSDRGHLSLAGSRYLASFAAPDLDWLRRR